MFGSSILIYSSLKSKYTRNTQCTQFIMYSGKQRLLLCLKKALAPYWNKGFFEDQISKSLLINPFGYNNSLIGIDKLNEVHSPGKIAHIIFFILHRLKVLHLSAY